MRKKLIGISAGAVCLGTLLYPQAQQEVQAVQRVQTVQQAAVQKAAVRKPAVQKVQDVAPLERFELEPVAGISREVLNLALNAVQCATSRGDIDAPPTLTVID